MPIKANFLYLCRKSNAKPCASYENAYLRNRPENHQGVLSDGAGHDVVLVRLDRLYHARQGYGRRCGGSLATVLCHALEQVGIDIQIGTMVFFLNAVLLLIAGFIIGWNFGVKTIFCVVVISLGMNFWQSVLPEGDFLHLERILAVILGGILAGIGIALCFAQGGSTGGTDIVAMIINKYRTVSYGKILIFSDFIIIGSSLLVGFHIDTVIYGYVMTAVVGYTVDMIMAGNQQSSQVLIVTHDYEKMADAIAQNVHRGVTLLDSQGWYTKERSKVVMVVCRKRETATILKFVKTIDPDAFMSVGSVMGVYGKGFQAISKP